MNSAFRDIILMKEYTLLKAVALAIVVQMIGFHLMATMGYIQLYPKALYWGAMIVGGFIFGHSTISEGTLLGCNDCRWLYFWHWHGSSRRLCERNHL